MSIEIKEESDERSKGLFRGAPAEVDDTSIKDSKTQLDIIQSKVKSINAKLNIILLISLASLIFALAYYKKAQDKIKDSTKAIENIINEQQRGPRGQ